jgi:tRNA pseudouridine38-40 synthase
MFDIGAPDFACRAQRTQFGGPVSVRTITPMATTRLDIEYDGSNFRGWAAQPGLRTVQGELESALATVLRREVGLSVAGRTDAGVHAWGQVASYADTEPAAGDLASRLNGLLGDDVAVIEASPAPDGFDARHDARSRTYCYRVLSRPAPSAFERGRALWVSRPLDREALRACAEALPGTHDFTAFTPTETDHVRFEREVMRAEWVEEGEILAFWIEADAFMHNMVRALVGTMLEVADARRGVEDFQILLDGAPRERAGETAPAHGLYLASVAYS